MSEQVLVDDIQQRDGAVTGLLAKKQFVNALVASLDGTDQISGSKDTSIKVRACFVCARSHSQKHHRVVGAGREQSRGLQGHLRH
jgi:hypothetical protein